MSSVYSQIATRNLYNAGIAGLGYDVTVGARYVRIVLSARSDLLEKLVFTCVHTHTHTYTHTHIYMHIFTKFLTHSLTYTHTLTYTFLHPFFTHTNTEV